MSVAYVCEVHGVVVEYDERPSPQGEPDECWRSVVDTMPGRNHGRKRRCGRVLKRVEQ